MINALADRVAGFVVRHDDNAEDREVLAYGFGLIISGIVTYIAIFGSALIFSLIFFAIMLEMLVTVFVYAVMRLVIGGAHANSRITCFISYSAMLYLCIALSFMLSISVIAVVALYFVNIVLLVLYAPADTAAQPMVRNKPARKIGGLAMLTLSFGISLFFGEMQVFANILIFVSTLTCILLHPLIYIAYRCEKS